MRQDERIASTEELDAQRGEDISAQIRCAMPAIVTRVNLEAQTVEVKLALHGKVKDTEGEVRYVQYPILPDVPIVWPRAGGFALTFPVKVDDECLVIFADRCIDAWWQSGGVQKPMDERMHDLSDAFALFGATSQPQKLPDVKDNAVELRDDDRINWISLRKGSLDINIDGATTVHCHDAEVNIDNSATVNVGSSTTLNCPTNTINGNVNINGNTVMKGTLLVTSKITGQGGFAISGGGGTTCAVTGSLDTTGDVTAGGISLQGHTHTEQGDGAETSSAH